MEKMRGKEEAFVLNLNMSKAYDRVEWGFLKAALQKLGFNQHVVNMLMECITSVTMSILISGSSKGYIRHNKGIR